MPGAFWDSWQLWEKLCFVLASGIVVVICLGCLKLVHSHWKLRKYTAIALDQAAVKQEMQRALNVKALSVKRGTARDIPFGVRALERGVEVDGVWVSGANTPSASRPGSPLLQASSARQKVPQRSPASGQALSSSKTTRIAISPPENGDHSNAQSRPDTSKFAAPPMDRSVSPQRSSHRHLSMATEQQPQGRPTYQPRRSSGLRFSNLMIPENNAAFATREDHAMGVKGKGKQPEGRDEEAVRGHNSRSMVWSGSFESELHESSWPSSSDVSAESLTNPTNTNPDSKPRISEESNPFLTPSRTSMDEPIAAFPLGQTYDSRTQHAQTMQSNEIAYGDGHANPLQPTDVNRNLRESQVIRKINSGFEILRPGTLDKVEKPRQSIDFTDRREDADGKARPKKLQRKSLPPSVHLSVSNTSSRPRAESAARLDLDA